jgi:hypothetical protein
MRSDMKSPGDHLMCLQSLLSSHFGPAANLCTRSEATVLTIKQEKWISGMGRPSWQNSKAENPLEFSRKNLGFGKWFAISILV